MLNSWALRAACLLSSVLLTLRPHPSWAQSEPRVDDEESLIREGVALRREGRDQDALALFERAYQRRRSPRSAAQLGLCEQALGRWVPAERYVREALAHESDPWIQRNRATLEGALRVAEQHLATVEIVGGIDGAELFVDGERVGALPADRSLRVVSGTTRVEHRLHGDATMSRVVTVEPGAIERVSFPMQRPSPQPTIRPSSPPQRSNDGSSNGLGLPLTPPVHWSVWASSASVGAGLVTTIAGFAVGSSIDGAYRRDCVERDAEPTCVERMLREQATLDTLSIVTGVGWTLAGLGAIGTGVGIALSIAGRRERSLHVLPTASGLLLRGAF